MSLVVDTSVIIAILTNEKTKSKLIAVTEGEELLSPLSLQWEVGNAFSAMFKRNRITLELANKAMEYYSLIPLRFIEIDMRQLKKSTPRTNTKNIVSNFRYFHYLCDV